MTPGQKESWLYLSPLNQDRWLSPQRTHTFEYVTKSRAKAKTVKVELLKPTTPKNCILMPFVETNSHLTTKIHNFDIKCQSNSEIYDWHVFLGTSLGVVRTFHL